MRAILMLLPVAALAACSKVDDNRELFIQTCLEENAGPNGRKVCECRIDTSTPLVQPSDLDLLARFARGSAEERRKLEAEITPEAKARIDKASKEADEKCRHLEEPPPP
jgi:hypothetical protein